MSVCLTKLPEYHESVAESSSNTAAPRMGVACLSACPECNHCVGSLAVFIRDLQSCQCTGPRFDLFIAPPPPLPPIKSTDGITVCLIHVTELNQHGDISVVHASKLNKNIDSLAKRNTNWASFSLCVATDGFCLKLRLSALFNSSSFLRIWTYPGTYSTPNAFVHSYRFDAGLYSILYVNKVAAGMLNIIFLFCFLHNIDYWRISF